MKACPTCGGVGYGSRGPQGFEDTGLPCPSCNPDAEPREPGSFAPKPEPRKTFSWADAPGRSGPNDRPQTPAEAGFSPQQVAAQRARDAAAEAGDRR